METMEIETSADSMNAPLIFHLVNDVLGFVLYMHQQIPSILQDMGAEFDMMRSEYEELEADLAQTQMKASFRRKHTGRMREIKHGIRRLEKLMSSISCLRDALQLAISENPNVEEISLILGGSTSRPQYVYHLCFSHGKEVTRGAGVFTKDRTAEVLSRKAIRAMISRGAGSGSYPGPTKLFLLVKAPSSFNQPLHFLPKRDFTYKKKTVAFHLRVKCKDQDHGENEVDQNPDGSFFVSLKSFEQNEMIWFQCRHVINGLASRTTSSEE